MEHNQIPQQTMKMEEIRYAVQYLGAGVTLNIFDTSSAEEFRTLVPMFARGLHVGVVVYDLMDKESLDHVTKWVTYLRDNSDVRRITIVGNKVDLLTEIGPDNDTE
jgi:GTPase SAR1 family protein